MDIEKRVGESRLLLDGHLPFPGEIGCVDYAIGEMYEYRDAIMRQENPDHKRNNERTADPRKELGQAMYMIVSAMLWFPDPDRMLGVRYPSAYVDTSMPHQYYFNAVSELADAGLHFLQVDWVTGVELLQFAWLSCIKLCQVHGWEVTCLIEETCGDFERKHVPGVM